VWIDRYNRKTIMICADALTALASGALGLSFLIGTPSLIFVYCMLFIRAIGNTFHTPALQASIPSLVPVEALERAGGLGQTVNAFSNMISPLLGAFLLDILPLGAVMLLDIGGAALAIFMIAGVDIAYDPVNKDGKVSVLHDMRQGFQCLVRNKAILTVSVFVLLATVIFVPYGSLLPLMVKSHFSGNAAQVGFAQTCYSIGLLAGSFVMGILRKNHKAFLTISLAFVVFGIFGFLSGLIPSSGFGLFLIALLVMGCASSISNIPYIAYIQRTIPKEHLGKILSLVRSLITLGTPVGLLLAGPIAETVGITSWMLSVGILMSLTGIGCYLATKRFDINHFAAQKIGA
jgi:DHA3 family macrolide efflux protein-like MFS transporter